MLDRAVKIKNDIIWRVDQAPDTYAGVRVASAEARREAQEVPLEGVANAAARVLRANIALSQDEFVKLTAKSLGFPARANALSSICPPRPRSWSSATARGATVTRWFSRNPLPPVIQRLYQAENMVRRRRADAETGSQRLMWRTCACRVALPHREHKFDAVRNSVVTAGGFPRRDRARRAAFRWG